MASRNTVFFLLILFLNNWAAITGATFENVLLTLKWRNGMQDNKTVTVSSDDQLRSYVGEFGEVLVQNQNIPQLTPNSVSNLLKVTHLHLTDCKIEKIQPGAFKTLPALQDLNLSDNLLDSIENGIFDNLKFTSLYLENNRIASISDAAFNNLKMEYLFIDDNRISIWKSEWFSGTPLISISMRNNLLKNIPRLAFEYLWHFDSDVVLQRFILSNNKLQSIDPDAFEGVKIIYSLDVQNNSLRHLEPGLFDCVKTIDHIDLSDNQISDIYYETFRRTKVTQLNVYNNFIRCISPDVFNVTRLETLNIGNNPISCECGKIWTDWKRNNQNPQISNLLLENEDCRSTSPKIKFLVSLLVPMFFVVLFTLR